MGTPCTHKIFFGSSKKDLGFAELSFQKILHQKAFQSSKKGPGQPLTEAKLKDHLKGTILVKKFAPNSKTKPFLASLQDRGVQELKKGILSG